jgi:hypothetical protein
MCCVGALSDFYPRDNLAAVVNILEERRSYAVRVRGVGDSAGTSATISVDNVITAQEVLLRRETSPENYI